MNFRPWILDRIYKINRIQAGSDKFCGLQTPPRLWIFKGAYVGQASRLTSNSLLPQASRPRYMPIVPKRMDCGANPLSGLQQKPPIHAENSVNSVETSSSAVRLLVVFLLLVLSPAILAAKPKDDPSPVSPSVGRDIQVHLVREGSAELVLEGIAMPGQVVQFEILKPPKHGSLGPSRRVSKDKVAFPYAHDGSKGAATDRVEFRLKTGVENAWGRISAKIFLHEPASRLGVDPESLDFGAIPIGGDKTLSLRIRNAGGGLLKGLAEISPMWTIEGDASFELAEGASRVFLIRFSPTEPETQQGRIVFKTGATPEPSVLLRGEGEYRFSVPAEVAIQRDDEEAKGILRVQSRAAEPLRIRLEAPSPLVTGPEIVVQPDETAEIPLSLEKKHYTVDRVRLIVSDGLASREVRVKLPPPPALLEWEKSPVFDIGRIPFRHVPEIEIGLRNAGATSASVRLSDGHGGLFLAPSQPRSFDLPPGGTARVRTVWKLSESPGQAKARIIAEEGGMSHHLDLLAQVEPPPPERPQTNSAATPDPSPSPSPSPVIIVTGKESDDLKRRMPAEVTTRLVPEGGAATAIVTWKYRGPQPARFHLESRMAVREVVDPGKVFEKRLSVPEELPPAPVVAKWLPVEAAAIQQLDGETWQGRVPGLPSGYHPLRIAVRAPPDGKRIDYVEFPLLVGDLPKPPWIDWAWGGLGLLSLLYLLGRKYCRKSD